MSPSAPCLTLTLLAAALLGACARPPVEAPPVAGSAPSVRAERALATLPLYFLPNRGQLDSPEPFYVDGHDDTVLFDSEGVSFTHSIVADTPKERLSFGFVGATKGVQPVGEAPSEATYSWFRSTREHWKTRLPMYARVAYRGLWPGIDLVYSGERGRLKWTLEIAPGADPSVARLSYRGAEATLLPDGSLQLVTAAGTRTDDKPVAWQDGPGGRASVDAAFELDTAARVLGVRVGPHDPSLPLVVDPPSFVYAGLLGGVAADRGLGIDVDAKGCAYVTGQVDSIRGHGFDYDAYVAKLNPEGTGLVYLAVLSGTHEDESFDIVVDAEGNAYITGGTASPDYPAELGPDLTFGGSWDTLVTKIAPGGDDLAWSGYLGGAKDDFAEGIALDAQGNVYVEGPTSSDQRTFPMVAGPDLTYNGGDWDTFVAKIKATPDAPKVEDNLAYCGYIGGAGTDDGDEGTGATGGHVDVDASGAAFVSGFTTSTEATFPDGDGFGDVPGFDHAHGGDADAFVVKIAPDGRSLAYATYIGGAGHDLGFGMKVDGRGAAYLTGGTDSDQTTFPVAVGPDLTYAGGDSQGGDAFVAKLDPTGTRLEYCGYIGGSDVDVGYGLELESDGSVIVIGYTESSEATFPVVGGPDLTYNGAGDDIGDAFVARVRPVPSAPEPARNLDFCGYIGGDGNDLAFWAASDSRGNVWVVGDTASTHSPFPGAGQTIGPAGTDRGNADNGDAFVVKVAP